MICHFQEVDVYIFFTFICLEMAANPCVGGITSANGVAMRGMTSFGPRLATWIAALRLWISTVCPWDNVISKDVDNTSTHPDSLAETLGEVGYSVTMFTMLSTTLNAAVEQFRIIKEDCRAQTLWPNDPQADNLVLHAVLLTIIIRTLKEILHQASCMIADVQYLLTEY